MSDFLLQKQQNRADIYHRPPGIWYSDQLRRWMVTSPDLVRQAMYDSAFSVPSYDISSITERLKIDVEYLNRLREWFPLAVEGSKHRILREKFARHIAQFSKPALDALGPELESKREFLLTVPAREPFCLHSCVLRPTLMKVLVTLADLVVPIEWRIEDLPLLFDVRLPVRDRKELNQLVGDIIDIQKGSRSVDELYLRTAILTLSVNTLVGSVGWTIIESCHKAEDRTLHSVAWPTDLIRTGLPVVEKVAVVNATLGGQQIRQGQGLRLFVESEGVKPNGIYSFSDLFFAVGSHKCLGMNFSKHVWGKFRELLAHIDRPMRIIKVRERESDYVFNFPNFIEVQFDD